MVGIRIRTLQIQLEWLELAFKCFESRSNGWSWHSNASNPVRMVGVGIQIQYEWLELAFERFQSRSNGWEFFLFFFLILVGEIAQWLVG